MKKLTSEQAEWLIGQLGGATTGIKLLNMDAVKAIIKQCTEKEFPGLRMNIEGNAKLLSVMYKNDIVKDANLISFVHKNICYDSYDIFNFTYDEFKQFTEGCQKIVGWLEGRE